MSSMEHRSRGAAGRVRHQSGTAGTAAAVAISVVLLVVGLGAPATAGAGDGMNLDGVVCQDGVVTVVTFVGNQTEEDQEFDVLLDGRTRPANWPLTLDSRTAGLHRSPVPGLVAGSTHDWAMYRQGALVDEVPFVTPNCGATNPPPAAASVKAKPKNHKSKLFVNVNPNKGKGYWKFKVQKKRASGKWKTFEKTYKTRGKGETRTLNFKKGTYRVKVKPKYGYQGATSNAVRLKR